MPGLDIDDLLRAQIVLAVSALDYYVHELTRLGMIEVFEGHRPQTDAFQKFQVTMIGAINGIATPGTSGWLDNEIRTKHGYASFQQADKVADAIRLFSGVPLWNSVSAQLGIDAALLKQQLRLIIERRNKIAHEADLDPSFPGVRWPITAANAIEATDFIESLCEAIHAVVV